MEEERHEFLNFELDVDGPWPPANRECLPVRRRGLGFEILVPPLFVKGLSVGDVVEAEISDGVVVSWRHLHRSKRTTVWVARLSNERAMDAQVALRRLKDMGCAVVEMNALGISSLDVPEAVGIGCVDDILEPLVAAGAVAVAFPSMRHDEV